MKAIWLLLLIIPYGTVLPQNFKIEDKVISDTSASLPDPEIDFIGHHFCWANAEGVWVGDIDPQTGAFIPANGKGVLVDSTPSYRGMQLVVNGPEWAICKNGSVIIYPDSVNDKIIQIGTARYEAGGWVSAPLPNSQNRIPYFGSYDADYSKDGITCASYDPLTMKKTGMRLRTTSDTTEVIPPDLSGGRWIKGFYGISLGQEKNPPYEAGYFDVNKNEYIRVATFTDPIDQVWVVPAEEYGTYALLCIVKKSEQDEIALFLKIGNRWRQVDSIRLPTDRKEIFSPEPFFWKGQTYLFLIARPRADQPKSLYDQVWIVRLDPRNRLYRMISEATAKKRTDPEVYYTTTEPVIYYTETRPDGRKIIHRCATGLAAHHYAKTPFAKMTFQKDYFPGTFDINGRYLGSTETMTIVRHKGKLFAGMGNWMDYPWRIDTEGSQILRKDSALSFWVVDTSFGYQSMRTDALLSVTFEKDCNGNLLPEPVNLLVCGAGYGLTTSQREVVVWTRDDVNGVWRKNLALKDEKKSGIRSFCMHTDKVTGLQWLFCGVAEGNIIKAAYDTTDGGKLVFDVNEEMSNLGRVMAMCECNGDLYAAAGVDIVAGDTLGGLYRRVDGFTPSWELVYRWPYTPVEDGDEPNIMRGITCVPDPKGSGRPVIIGTRANPGVVEVIEPFNNHRVYTEFYIRDFFASQWDLTSLRGPSLSAYNYFVPDTLEGEPIWWMSLWVEHPENNRHPYNGSHFLVRYQDGSYRYGDIYDDNHPLPTGENLRACRTICKSPFAAEPNTYYFGGYDCAKDTSHNTSWIYKGSIVQSAVIADASQALPKSFLLHQNYPNPFNPSTTIRFRIPSDGRVTLILYNVMGRQVGTLVDEFRKAGDYTEFFNARNFALSSGVYFYQVRIGNLSQTRKMVLMQ